MPHDAHTHHYKPSHDARTMTYDASSAAKIMVMLAWFLNMFKYLRGVCRTLYEAHEGQQLSHARMMLARCS